MNPIPLTLALAPFDRLETIDKVTSRLDTLRSKLDEMIANRALENEAAAEAHHRLRKQHPDVMWFGLHPLSPSGRELDVQAEIDALSALLALAQASTSDYILLSTHAYSLIA